MPEYKVATQTASGINLPHIFECPICHKTCHLLEDDTSIFVEGSTIKTHEHSEPTKDWRHFIILFSIWLCALIITLILMFILDWLGLTI